MIEKFIRRTPEAVPNRERLPAVVTAFSAVEAVAESCLEEQASVRLRVVI